MLRINALPREVATLPEHFRGLGYRTFGFSANPNVDRPMGFDRGFDVFACTAHTTAPKLIELVMQHRDEFRRSRPAFLYVHFMDPHAPRHAREPWYVAGGERVGDLRSRYDSEIRYLDHHLPELFEALDWERNTLVLVLSDHGEEFMEHGQIGHRFSLHGEVNRVLLLLSGPEHGIAAGTVDTHVSLVDLVPTLLELCGGAAPPDLDGLSLVPLLRGEPAPEAYRSRVLYAHRAEHHPEERHLWAAIRGRWKLIEDARSAGPQLYHMERDPGERSNVAGEVPQITAELARRIAEFRAGGIRAPGERVEIPLDEPMLELLQELGYTGDGS